MSRLRVLHTIPTLRSRDGGPARSAPSLAAAQAAHGADVVVWSQQEAEIETAAFKDVRFVSGPLEAVCDDSWRPHVIHDHGLWLPANHRSARFARKHRIPRIVSPRGMLEPWSIRHRRVRKAVAWRLYQHRDLAVASALHATSDREMRQFRQLGLTQPTVYLPNGVVIPESLREKIAAPSGALQHDDSAPREILFLSRLHPVKGIELLLEAYSHVRAEGWCLTIVGDGDPSYVRSLRQLVIQLGLSADVRFEAADHSDTKWLRLRRADVVVLPSQSENFGIIVAESLAVGTPVITTTGTPWARLRARNCGWYVEPTVRGLARALLDATSRSSNELRAMGHRGRAWVLSEFDWSQIAEGMLESYEWLTRPHAGLTPRMVHLDETGRRAA